MLTGTLLGAVLAGLLSSEQMTAFGWRIPFVVGGVLGFYALYMRSRTAETEAFTAARPYPAAGPVPSMWSQILAHPVLLMRVIGMTVGATVIYQVWAVAAPAYAISSRGIDPAGALWAGVLANLVFLAALPVWGMISDRVGRNRC